MTTTASAGFPAGTTSRVARVCLGLPPLIDDAVDVPGLAARLPGFLRGNTVIRLLTLAMLVVCGTTNAWATLASQQVVCPLGAPTTVSGTVFAPNGIDPLPNVLVYVPNAPVDPFSAGVACGVPVSGSPLVGTFTDTDGSFRLISVPAGPNIPLVIQAGKWRRQVTLPTVAACRNTAVPAAQSRLPRIKAEGDIPLIAVVTGSLDAAECVFRKIGIGDSEFSNPQANGGTGRIQLFQGSGSPGALINASTPLESQLWGSQASLNQYDMTMFTCQGNQFDQTVAAQNRLISYANAGGRIYATHYAYTWLYNDAPFSGTAAWNVEQNSVLQNQTAFVNQTFPKGQQLAQWLQMVNATPTLGQIPLQLLRKDQDGVVAPTQSWLTIDDPNYGSTTMQFTFDTPVGAAPADQCGRVLFNEFHVENVANSGGMAFPAECTPGAMTPQEKLLEFSLFDLTNATKSDQPFTLTYDGNANTGGSAPVDATSPYSFNAAVTVLGVGSLVKTGYIFAGWNTASNGSGTAYIAGNAFYMPANNVTLYAQWNAPTTYNVSYNGNGSTSGSVPVDGTAYAPATTVTVLGNTGTLTKPGYTFAGWNTASNGSGNAYLAGNTFSMPANNVTLYAQWPSTTCTGLCLQQVVCPNPAVTTTVSGTVFAPNGSDPLPNVLVYVPNAPVDPFSAGVACGVPVSGSPLVSTITGTDGKFLLRNMPVGPNIPLVIQAGKWRSQVTLATVAACTNTVVPVQQSRLPRIKAEGDIPLIAVVTGSLDAAECVFRKIGIGDSEFSNPQANGGTGRIQLFQGSGSPGALINASTPLESQLWGSQASLNQYDMTMFTCQGNQFDQTVAAQNRLISYANAGGRIYATHYAYTWLYNDAPFSGTAAWNVNQLGQLGFSADPQTAFVNQTFPKGQQLAQWLQMVNATPTLGQIPLHDLRKDQDGVVAPTQSWLTIDDPNYGSTTMQFTFDTPVGAAPADQCGRVLFNEFHVENVANSGGMAFPAECTPGAMTPQEKLLEFGLFDLINATSDQTFTLTYDGNANTGGSAPVDATSPYRTNAVVTVLGAGSLVKTGYTFAGWGTASNVSGTPYLVGETFSMAANNVTLYALWTSNAPTTYSVSYDGNGSTSGSAPIDGTAYTAASAVTVLGAGSLIKTDYTFAGWNTASNGSGTAYIADGTFSMPASNVTLYAQWTLITYSVSYNGNGSTAGSVPIDGTAYTPTATVTVLGAGSLVRSGYTFAGWNTAGNGSGTAYLAGGSFSMPANNITLYAQWTLITYSVSYNGNGSTGGSAPVDGAAYAPAATVTVLGTGSLVRSGYTFAGWNTAGNGSGTAYLAGGSFSMPANNVTLYAQWTLITYSVGYSGNGSTAGSVPIDGTAYTPTATVTVLGAGSLVRSGYTFAGWNTASNGSGTAYVAGSSFSMPASNVTVYAQWTLITYSVTYNGNGSTGGSAPIDGTAYAPAATVTVTGAGSLVKSGYTFAGWNTAGNGSGTAYLAGGSFSMPANNITLYAQWTLITYNVSYNGNGSTGGTVPIDGTAYAPAAAVTVMGAGSLVKTGYTFAGWNTVGNGSGTTYLAGSSLSMPANNVTLYAQWTLVTYNVSYNGNGSTGGSAPVDGAAYAPATTVTVLGAGSLVKSGYSFAGWNTQAAGSGTTYAAGATFAMPAANVTLYAQWTQVTYSVSYNGNGSTGGSVPVDGNAYAPAATVTVLGAGSLTKSGYTFAGWNTASNGSGTAYLAGNTFSMPANTLTLYAQWTQSTIGPMVVSLVGVDPTPTMADIVNYKLTFSQPVTGLSSLNLSLTSTGTVVGATIGTIGGSGTTWTVAVNSGRSNGTVGLNVSNGAGIVNASGVALVGTLPFNGDIYNIDKGGTVIAGGQGQPDPLFGSNGYALFNLTQTVVSPGAIAVLSTGKILAAGGGGCGASSSNCRLQLARYLSTGAPDTGFGSNGLLSTSVTGINPDLGALIANGDGTFFVAGSRQSSSGTVPFVAKFASDGSLAAYGSGGMAALDSLLLGSDITGATVDASGRVIVTGTRPSAGAVGTDLFMARITTSGILDKSFGNGGVASFNISTTGTRDDFATDVAVQSSGRIVAGGRTLGASGFDFLLLRVTSSGAKDKTFGISGAVTTHFAGAGDNSGRKLVVQPDDSIVLVGPVNVGGSNQCGVARFLAEGTLDTSFGTDANGQVLIPLGQGCLDVTLQPDGKLIVTALDRQADVMLATYARLLANGTLDADFGSNGVQDITSYTNAAPVAVYAGGSVLSGLVKEDIVDGIQKSYVVQLGSTLTQATTTTIKSILPSPAQIGRPYTVQVSVTAASGTPAGTVNVDDGAGASCTVTLISGAGSCALISTTKGKRTVTASYAGSSLYQSSASVSSQKIGP